MNHKQQLIKKISLIHLIALMALTLLGCKVSIPAVLSDNDGNITICHATTDTANPYEEVSVDFEQLEAHADHPDDLIPAPADGCPETITPGTNDGKITICHATDSATNPYNEITIDFNGLNGHGKHQDDIIPAPESGCSSVQETPTITETPAITETPTITETATVTTTPEATTSAGDTGEKITICHATGSSKNPYVQITISINGLNGHDKHARDIIPAPAEGCPSGSDDKNNGNGKNKK
jgi:hypothetical protein